MSEKIPLKLIIGSVSNEKGVSEEVICQAIEAALVSATKKKHGIEMEVRVKIDRKSGQYHTHRLWEVVPDPTDEQPILSPTTQMAISEAMTHSQPVAVGDILEIPMESVGFGRIAAQAAKQVILKRVREAEYENVAEEFRRKIGQLVTLPVKKVSREIIVLDLGSNAEAVIRREELLPRDMVRIGDRIRCYLQDVVVDTKGPELILSRTCNEMLVALFKIEVPEVGEGVIEVKRVARDPGIRSKVAVKTNDGRIDPVGACIGMRRGRIQAISNELGGERVDVVLWDDSPAQFVMNAMAPAEVVSIVMDEETQTMEVAVTEEHLSQAIGRNGQNVKLAKQLTGWTLNVVTEKEAAERTTLEQERLLKLFVERLTVEETVAAVLIEEGFTSVEEVAYVPVQELLTIDGFNEEIVHELRARAQAALAQPVEASTESSAMRLLELPGMSEALVDELAKKGIITRDDLAELAVGDLCELAALDETKAAALIMAARAHWFV